VFFQNSDHTYMCDFIFFEVVHCVWLFMSDGDVLASRAHFAERY
jgi:hypothetical protein